MSVFDTIEKKIASTNTEFLTNIDLGGLYIHTFSNGDKEIHLLDGKNDEVVLKLKDGQYYIEETLWKDICQNKLDSQLLKALIKYLRTKTIRMDVQKGLIKKLSSKRLAHNLENNQIYKLVIDFIESTGRKVTKEEYRKGEQKSEGVQISIEPFFNGDKDTSKALYKFLRSKGVKNIKEARSIFGGYIIKIEGDTRYQINMVSAFIIVGKLS